MLCRVSLGLAICVGLTTLAYSAEDFSARILRDFPGKWELNDGKGARIGDVEWKLVSEGRALAGGGTNVGTGAHHGLAGWDANEKKWVHVIFYGDGGYMRYELNKFRDGVYSGTVYFADATGKASSGKCQNKIIDNDHFEVTQVVNDSTFVLQFSRKKN